MIIDPFAIVASLQRVLADRLQTAALGHKRGELVRAGVADLATQLAGAGKVPRGLAWTPLGQSELLDLASIARDGSPLGRLGQLVAGLDDRLRALFDARSPADFASAIRDLFATHFANLDQTVLPLVGSQLGVLVSLVTTTSNLPEAGKPIEDALLAYFFDPDGFRTVDGVKLVAPVHLADLKSPDTVQSVLSKATGEQYVRDLVRVVVEATDDVRYGNLATRRDNARGSLHGAPAQAKFDGWFRGFPAMAESATMQAVEEATLGVSQFQTNAIIAASAGAFAGSVARKAAQHVFLFELGF